MEARFERLLESGRIGVIATTARDGRPRQSVVYFARDGEQLLVSTLAGRSKTSDVERTGWASLAIAHPEPPYGSAVFSGPAEVLTEGIGPATAAVMQRVMGADEPPEPQTDAQLAEIGRVILRIDVEKVSAVSHLDP